MPVIGFLDGGSLEARRDVLVSFRQGLNEVGFIEGQNITIEYRFALGQYDQLSALATDLVVRRCALAGGNAASLAAKQATRTVPIVFAIGSDPVALGLVDGLARPDGNITGVSFMKRHCLLRLDFSSIQTVRMPTWPSEKHRQQWPRLGRTCRP